MNLEPETTWWAILFLCWKEREGTKVSYRGVRLQRHYVLDSLSGVIGQIRTFSSKQGPGTTSAFEVYVIATWVSTTTERITLISSSVGLHVVSFL